MTTMTPASLTGSMALALNTRAGLNLAAGLNATSVTLGAATMTGV